MLALNLCKLVPEHGTVEIIDEFFFERLFIDTNKVVVSKVSDLQKIMKPLKEFRCQVIKDDFSLYFIRIMSRHKLITEVKELSIVNSLNLSKNFNFNGDEIYIEFDSNSIENNYEDFKIFKKKEELLSRYKNEIIGKKRWFNLTKLEKNYWLDFAFSQMNDTADPLDLNIAIDGNYILCKEDMYCYLGEEVYGVLGYLAYNLDAFADAISVLPLKIKWINFEYSKDNFDSKEVLEDLVAILKQYSSLEISYK